MEKFSLIVHPLSWRDFARIIPPVQYFPEKILKGAARFWPPFQISAIKGLSSSEGEIEGELRCCPLTPEHFLDWPVEISLRRIKSAVQSAAKNGAKIAGLGAWTAVPGERGSALAPELGIPVTTGDSLTIYMALEAVKTAARERALNWDTASIAVLGVTGLSESALACARLLARENRFLTLVVRERGKTDRTVAEILYETGVAVRVTDQAKEVVRQADVVIAFTANEDAFEEIKPGDFKRGAVLCDVLWPRNLAQRIAPQGQDLLVIEDGVVAFPGTVEMDSAKATLWGCSPSQCPAWMAEVMILALEKRFETFSLGRGIGVGQIEEIGRLALKHGFKLAL